MNETLEVRPAIEDQVASAAELNVFARSPEGYDCHVKLSVEDPTKIVSRLAQVSQALMNHNFTPSQRFGAARQGSEPTKARDDASPVAPPPNQVAYWVVNPDGSRSCTLHGLGRLVPAGVSKAGKHYGSFWACDTKVNGMDCKPKDREP